MCLFTHTKSQVLVATKNIVVYKTLNFTNRAETRAQSPVYDMDWRKGRIHKPYSFPYTKGQRFSKHGKMLYLGLHAYTTKKEAQSGWGSDIVAMVIPRGALYIRGKDHEILTNQLLWK